MADAKKSAVMSDEQALDEALGSFVQFVTTEESEEMAQRHTPFYVEEIEEGESSFGKRYELTISVDGEKKLLTVPKNENRDALIKAMQKAIDKKGRVGPLNLIRRDIGDGKTFIWFKRASESVTA